MHNFCYIVDKISILQFSNVPFRTNTEMWTVDSNWYIFPILSEYYSYGGLFLVDDGFCSKN